MKDKRKHCGAVDKCFLKQQFHKSNMITFAVQKFWSHTPSAIGFYGRLAGWLADGLADEMHRAKF